MDLESGAFVEKENICPTPQLLYNMCDPEFMYESLKDDLMVQMYSVNAMIEQGKLFKLADYGLSLPALRKLAEILKIDFNEAGDDGLYESLNKLTSRYGHAATINILAKSRRFAEENEKKLLIVLFNPYGEMKQLIYDQPREDQEIVDYLQDNGYLFFDMNQAHATDFKCFNLTFDEYFNRYISGHYTPAGNHFFAHSIKDTIVGLLDPKPVTYSKSAAESIIGYEGMLK